MRKSRICIKQSLFDAIEARKRKNKFVPIDSIFHAENKVVDRANGIYDQSPYKRKSIMIKNRKLY